MRYLLIIVLLLIAAFLIVLYYHGFFSTYKISEKEIGPYTIATKRFIGSYSSVAPTMTEVDATLRGMGINSTKGIGLYYDDPAKVSKDKLRSDVGNILEEVDVEVVNEIKLKYDVKEIPIKKAVVVEFPIKSILSYMIGPMKIYPTISKYWEEKGYSKNSDEPGIEIYDIPNKTILYIMPISK